MSYQGKVTILWFAYAAAAWLFVFVRTTFVAVLLCVVTTIVIITSGLELKRLLRQQKNPPRQPQS